MNVVTFSVFGRWGLRGEKMGWRRLEEGRK
jgi:hypothetical protein